MHQKKKRRMKKLLITSMLTATVLSGGGLAYAKTQALPNATIVSQANKKYLTDSQETKYTGWFIDSNEDWYYYKNSIRLSNQWLSLNGVWYYLRADGSMVSNSWYNVNGKSYYFGLNGGMYVSTSTPDGKQVNENGEAIASHDVATKETFDTNYVFKGEPCMDVKTIDMRDDELYILGTYSDMVDDGDEIEFHYDIIPVKENITVKVDNSTMLSDGVGSIDELAERIEGQLKWYQNSFVILELDGTHVSCVKGSTCAP